ncbi:thioesterase family protein, partial [Alcanivorax sp. HI0044]
NLKIGTWIVHNDERISITRRYQIVRESDGLTLLRGRTRWVCVALDSGKPRRMPPEFLKGYQITADE